MRNIDALNTAGSNSLFGCYITAYRALHYHLIICYYFVCHWNKMSGESNVRKEEFNVAYSL